MKDQKGKMSIKEMFTKINVKSVEPIHRGPLLRLLYARIGEWKSTDDDFGFFVVRIAFSDYGDLMLDHACLNYLHCVKENLEKMYDFEKIVADAKKNGSDLSDHYYQKYTEWLAIDAVDKFLNIGVYATEEYVC